MALGRTVQKQSLIDHPVTLIIGSGPAGLASALVSALQDTRRRDVVIITDRPTFTRDQIFRLDVDIIPFLEDIVGKELIRKYFDQKLIGPQQTLNNYHFHTIQIKTLEYLLFNALKTLTPIQIFHIQRESLVIDQAHHFVHVTTTDGQELDIRFKYLIAADGAAHRTTNKIRSSGIEYHPTQRDQLYNRHARATYKLPESLCSDVLRELISQRKATDMSVLKAMGWELYSVPEVRLFTVDDYFFMGAECPMSLSLDDEDMIDRWLRLVLESYCENVAHSLIKLDAAIFEVNLLESNRTLVPLPCPKSLAMDNDDLHDSCAYFFMIGDALRQTHYQTGSGAVVALRVAQAFGKFMASKQTLDDVQQYHADVALIHAINRERVDQFIEMRKERERKELPAGVSLLLMKDLFPANKKTAINFATSLFESSKPSSSGLGGKL